MDRTRNTADGTTLLVLRLICNLIPAISCQRRFNGRSKHMSYPGLFTQLVLLDNESFLMTAESKAAMRKARVSLWHIPSRSPDLNPVEKYWSHLRRWLRKHDLADLEAGRPPVMRAALKERVRRLLGSARAKTAARNTVRLCVGRRLNQSRVTMPIP